MAGDRAATDRPSLRTVAVELVLYALFVTAYFLLVLHLLGDWLHGLVDRHPVVYAFVALGLILAQGVILEVVTTKLMKLAGFRRG